MDTPIVVEPRLTPKLKKVMNQPSKDKEYVARYYRAYTARHANEIVHCEFCKKDMKKIMYSKHKTGKVHKLLEEASSKNKVITVE